LQWLSWESIEGAGITPKKIDEETIAFCQISGQGIVRSDRASASLHIFGRQLPISDLIGGRIDIGNRKLKIGTP
jgi:hypothetical protein